MELAVFAGVVERNVAVGPAFARVNFATVERFGIHVDAYGALLEFWQIQNLVNRFERIDMHGMRAVHLVDFRRNDFARATRSVFIFDAEILHFQAADRRGHPAILVAMIVDAAVLPDLPADRHALEKIVFENQIARVIPLGKKNILFERFRSHGVAHDVILNIFEGEVALGNGAEALDPIRDGECFDVELIWHG